MTKNERDMLFVIARATALLGEAAKTLAGAVPDGPDRIKFESCVKGVEASIEEFISLVDAEWLPK